MVSTSDDDDRFFFAYSSFLQPTTLYLAQPDGSAEAVRSLPARFDASGLQVEQHEAVSADGTRVPYFLVAREDVDLDGENPTLLYGYGGFEVALTPSYNEVTGAAWLERGGVYALANIRGGGEFGPAWHRAAQRENRQRAFDDFVAVAEDLVARGVTSPDHLGIQGGSNGGLLVGAAMTQRPDLFDAVVVSVPLLDMKRYHTLLAGASWMAEYGDPDDPDDWAFIRAYSPYQNVDAEADYPTPLFTTTTARRPRPPRPCAEDGGAHGVAGPRRPLLREHRGRPRGRRDAGAAGDHDGAHVQLPLGPAPLGAAPLRRRAGRRRPGPRGPRRARRGGRLS